MNALRSEVFMLSKRPLVYVICGIWILQIVLFAYGIPLIVANALPEGQNTAPLFAILAFPKSMGTILGSYPMFGGAVFLILGAFIGGAEFGWGTWKVRLWQGPSRWDVVCAKFVAAAGASALIALIANLAGFLTSYVISMMSGLPTDAPILGDILGGMGSSMLTAAAFCALGLGLAIITRSLALALAIGLVWTLAFESIVSYLVSLWSPLAFIQKFLLGPASGSLATVFGATPLSQGGTPGVVDAMPGAVAVVVLAVYLLLAAAISGVAINRRDVV